MSENDKKEIVAILQEKQSTIGDEIAELERDKEWITSEYFAVTNMDTKLNANLQEKYRTWILVGLDQNLNQKKAELDRITVLCDLIDKR